MIIEANQNAQSICNKLSENGLLLRKTKILVLFLLCITFAYGKSNSESCDKTWSEVCHLRVKVLEIYPSKNNEPSIKNLSDKEWIERANKLGTRNYTC